MTLNMESSFSFQSPLTFTSNTLESCMIFFLWCCALFFLAIPRIPFLHRPSWPHLNTLLYKWPSLLFKFVPHAIRWYLLKTKPLSYWLFARKLLSSPWDVAFTSSLSTTLFQTRPLILSVTKPMSCDSALHLPSVCASCELLTIPPFRIVTSIGFCDN